MRARGTSLWEGGKEMMAAPSFRAPAKILWSKRFVGKGDAGVKKRSGCCKAIARICALRRRGRQGNRVYSLSHPASASCGRNDSVSRGRDRAAPLPTHLLRICAGALKCPEQWGIPKLESGQSPTSSRQGVLVCGALRLPHDLICLPLLFPQNSLRDFCGNPERQESAFSPLTQGRLK